LVAKCSSEGSSNSKVECQDSITALSRADPARPIDCRICILSKAEALPYDFDSSNTHRDTNAYWNEAQNGADAYAGLTGGAIAYVNGDRKTDAAEAKRKAQAHLTVSYGDGNALSGHAHVGG